jgi:peptidoglycan/LPS O-acetylase OafA/YrhL
MLAALDHDQFRATRTFALLDGVRALAVLWVVAYHCEPSRLGLDFVARHGDLGVDVFFVLSGFLITTLLLRGPLAPARVQLGRFWVRRALRIFPLYYAAVLLYWLAARVGAREDSAAEFAAFVPSLLGYWSDWYLAHEGSAQPPFVHAWSLAVEEKFYLLWPVAVLLWPRATPWLCLLGIGAAIVWRSGLAAAGVGEARLYYPFELRIDALLWGSLLASMLHAKATYAWAAAAARPAVFWSALAALLATAAISSNADVWRYTVVPVASAVLIAGVVVRPSMPAAALLGQRWVRHVGVVSYGIYVLHPLCLHAVQRGLGGGAGARLDGLFEFALGAPLAVLVASASFAWFERPFLRLKDRFRGKGSAPPPPVGVPQPPQRRAASRVST